MIDVDALKLEVETLLAGLIGTYTFTTDLGVQTTPALRVEDGSDPYPVEPQVTGLEVVIRPEAAIAATIFLAGDRQFAFRSEITLKQFDISATTQTAREALMTRLGGLEEVGAIVPRDGRLNNIETCTLVVSNAFSVFG